MLAGHPDDQEWEALLDRVNKAYREARTYCNLSDDGATVHRRGKFDFVTGGVSFGNGSLVSHLFSLQFFGLEIIHIV